jgi:alpha-glucosidase
MPKISMMIACIRYLFIFLFFPGLSLFGQKTIRLQSPGGKILFEWSLVDGHPEYAVSWAGKLLIQQSSLELCFENNDHFGSGLEIPNPVFREGEDNYSLLAGKCSQVHDFYKEVRIPMQERAGKKRLIYFCVRVFDDGLAFRYEFPLQNGWSSYRLTDENSSFNLSGNPLARVGFMENFTSAHEHRYDLLPLRDIKNDTLMDMPALFEFPENIFLAITEANLVDYAGMSLIKNHGVLKSQLTPLPGQSEIKVKADLPHKTPWRVLLISDRIGALIESNLLTDLSEPCKIKDLSWLKPGKASFHWWNGDVSPDTTFEPGVEFEFNKYYIDFCARNDIEYHTVIGYRRVAWYQNDGVDYQPGPHSDVTKPRPGLDMQQICDYAKSKGVGIRVWVHWAALYPRLDSAFSLFQKWGIRGMMVDFMNRDDQEMINIQEKILQKAAEHQLEIQFHGVSKPTGLSRTYPNESTREGTLNYENDKWGNLITPDDDINIPFTRLLAGPTDYHLGGFRAMPASRFKVQFSRPHVLGTRCHMLAMYVILENHLSMVCDEPEAYEGQDGFDFIKEIPTVWDETKVIGAQTGQWISIARRKGEDWYIGTITNGTARSLTLPLGFLPPGNYRAEIYADAADATENPNHLNREERQLNPSDKISINLAGGGGQVIRLQKINPKN